MSADEGTPSVVQIYCRLELSVTDLGALLDRAATRLREADIDWPAESQTLDEAVAEMRADPLQAIASLLDVDAAVADLPGAELVGARWWAEHGDASERFQPGFGA